MPDPRMAGRGGAALSWSDDKQRLLDRLNARLAESPTPAPIHLVARRFLELIRAFPDVPTPDQVAHAVLAHDWPPGGWMNWDWDTWRGYTTEVKAALSSSDPAGALGL